MTRRFRRRPSTTVFALLALAVVSLARYTYDRILDRILNRPSLAALSILQEGDCDAVRVIDGESIVVRQTVTGPADNERATIEVTIRLLGIDCPAEDEP